MSCQKWWMFLPLRREKNPCNRLCLSPLGTDLKMIFAVNNVQEFGTFRLKLTNEHHLPRRALSTVWTSHHCSEIWHLARAKARAFFFPIQTFLVVACFWNRPLIWRNWMLSVVNEHAGGSPKPPKAVVFPISWQNQNQKFSWTIKTQK